jgi:pSer/pThr/pTyr-binding forkhead associated (FHA) protein
MALSTYDKTQLVNEPSPAMAWLVVRQGAQANQQLQLRAGSNTVGRDGQRAELVVDDPSVSGEHARIRYENGAFVLYDLASTNGTFVNGRRIDKQRLMDGDQVRLGRLECVFKMINTAR